ncbi:hypothetical protein FAES_3246 [Fibrella aestuarina BUZ 2]|uniref:Uncharacterized protein n=1 Tax=Fibrella aestuarina BUZ 2 TaxID=1166018 RepID=I0KAV2_9BACT|nr:hypothetical protein [Fibrella aestuarina]CCH01255.1 hypothetical protein FAES_3246 [Fibrella aestuarina BUZ 2]
MNISSVFPAYEPILRTPDCQPEFDQVVYYSGATNVTPLEENGLLRFKGALSNVPDNDGPELGVPLIDILPGGKGVGLRCCNAATKQKVRYAVIAPQTQPVMLHLRPVSTCVAPKELDEETPIFVGYDEGRIETAAQKAADAARQFNLYYGLYGNATAVTENGTSYVEIEVLKPGDFFHMKGTDGLSAASIVVPGKNVGLTPALIASLFPGEAVPAGTCLRAIELDYMEYQAAELLGQMTSSFGQTTQRMVPIQRRCVALFADNANATAAHDAAVTILKAQKHLFTTGATPTCQDFLVYPFSVDRADGGDAAAMATAKTDYSAVTIQRVAYRNGRSLYTVTRTASAKPAVVTAGDVIGTGTALALS